MRRVLVGLTVVLLTVLGALPASAQCAQGRVVGPETAGRCCWPGQRWNEGAARCEGPPTRCPDGFGAEGDRCVREEPTGRSAQLGSPAPSAADSPSDMPPSHRSHSSSWGDPDAALVLRGRPPRGGPVREPIMGVMQSGILLMSLGYGTSMGTAIACLSQYWCDTPAGFGLIPVVGGFLWGIFEATEPCCREWWGRMVGIAASGVQVVGLVMAIAGGAARRTRYESRGWALRLTGGPGEAGLGLALDF